MNFTKLTNWLKSSKSDFFLYAVIIVLVNLTGIQAYLRIDLTSRRTYSLSTISKQTVKSIEEPLSVKVFFSRKLPAPYNIVELYLKDLLGEYGRVGNQYFSHEFFNMDKEENKAVAEEFGINPVQIQQIRDDQMQLGSAYMGLVVSYGDNIEKMDNIDTTDGLEYDLTTLMQKMITRTDTLSGLSGKVRMTLYRSQGLRDFNISSFSTLDQIVYEAYSRVNRDNFDKIEYSLADPVGESEINALAERYGLQQLSWRKDPSSEKTETGVLGIVLEYGDRFVHVPLRITRGLLGGFGIQGLNDVDEALAGGLEALISSPAVIAYLTGVGEKSLEDNQTGSYIYKMLGSDIYEFMEVELKESVIPDHVRTLVINGPVEQLEDSQLYQIDQFLMRGGSLIVYLDPFREIMPQQSQFGGGQAYYIPISTGLERLLESYGIRLKHSYVLDKKSFIHRQGGMELPLYYIPIVDKENLDSRNSISRYLSNIVFLKTGELEIVLPGDTGIRSTVIARSSSGSWTMSGQIDLSPYSMFPPADDTLSSYPLAVLLEGKFNSHFDGPVDGSGFDNETLSVSAHLSSSTNEGKIFVIASSGMTTSQLLDEQGKSHNAVFSHNILDYMNGNEELNEMRSKGLSLNPLRESSSGLRNLIKYFNMAGIPVLVILAGLLVWKRMKRRQIRLQQHFAALGREPGEDASGTAKEEKENDR